MLEIQFKPIEQQDIYQLIADIRAQDLRELHNLGGDITHIIEQSVLTSSLSAAIFVKDQLMCLTGVVPISVLSNSGCPWMLGTNQLFKYNKSFYRYFTEVVDEMGSIYHHLENVIEVHNDKPIALLKRIGFKFSEPFIINRLSYYKFWKDYV